MTFGGICAPEAVNKYVYQEDGNIRAGVKDRRREEVSTPLH
jgi:hypothetical protein